MGVLAVLILLAGSVLIGVACHLIGRAREDYEWAIGTVGALYGGLLANTVSGAASPVVDGLSVIPALLGGFAAGGLLVFGFREFGVRSEKSRLAPVAGAAMTTRIRIGYTPELLREPVISQMARQFGVSVTIGRAEIFDRHGWVEVDITGSPAAVDAALALARRRAIELAFADLAAA